MSLQPERLVDALGRVGAVLAGAGTLVAFAVVVLRYGFGSGHVWLQEGFVWLHGAAIVLGIAFALRQGAHVRVDIVYSRLGDRGRARIDALGAWLFLLPLALTLGYVAAPYVADSWAQFEGSREAGGLPGLFLVKSLLLVLAVLLAALALRRPRA